MLAALAKVDVIFVGEQHNDPNTHRLEAAILEGLERRKVRPIVSLEMFERDVQPIIDNYLSGGLSEEELLETARPWPRYTTDYRPLVEAAKQRGWVVVAANVPRRIASAVAKSGRDTVAQLSESERRFVAGDLECPHDAYFDRFAATMTAHPGGAQTSDEKQAMTERYYWAQCVKDETMAESIVAALENPGGAAAPKPQVTAGPVVHYNGAFHSDFGLGTVERVRRRAPSRRLVVVTMLPVADLDAFTPSGEDLKRADYLVYTLSSPISKLPTPKRF
jgi:uncharacterized iron-regulated protein